MGPAHNIILISFTLVLLFLFAVYFVSDSETANQAQPAFDSEILVIANHLNQIMIADTDGIVKQKIVEEPAGNSIRIQQIEVNREGDYLYWLEAVKHGKCGSIYRVEFPSGKEPEKVGRARYFALHPERSAIAVSSYISENGDIHCNNQQKNRSYSGAIVLKDPEKGKKRVWRAPENMDSGKAVIPEQLAWANDSSILALIACGQQCHVRTIDPKIDSKTWSSPINEFWGKSGEAEWITQKALTFNGPELIIYQYVIGEWPDDKLMEIQGIQVPIHSHLFSFKLTDRQAGMLLETGEIRIQSLIGSSGGEKMLILSSPHETTDSSKQEYSDLYIYKTREQEIEQILKNSKVRAAAWAYGIDQL